MHTVKTSFEVLHMMEVAAANDVQRMQSELLAAAVISLLAGGRRRQLLLIDQVESTHGEKNWPSKKPLLG
jgi:hypothetical protein